MENKDDSNYINLSDFKLIPVTQIYNELNQGKEIYFLNENNEPVKVKSIEKIPYNGKIYGVDVENDIVLVRRGSENATAFWSGNSEGYSQDTFDLKVLGGSLELDHIIDPTQFKAYYNFSNTTHNTAYWGSPAAVRDLVGGTIATALQYGNLSQNDSKVAKVVADTGNDEPYWRFNFTIIETASTIDWIFVNISGRGNGTGGGETETAYVLNSSAAQYVSMGALLQSAVGIEFVSKNFTGSTEISNIINTSTKALVVYIEGVNYDTNDELAIDYAEVIVAYSLDQRAPYWYDASTNNTNPLPGANVSHNINWTDDVDLDYAILEINSTGTNCNTAANMSDLIISGAVAWSNISWATDQRCEGKMISWKQYANDSSNNWNVTSAQTYTVQNVNPTASFGTNQVNNSNSTSSSVFFELSCTDNLLVNKTQLWTNFTGTWHANQTNSTPVDGVTWNVSVAGIADGNYIWAAWCNDTLNNQDYENTNRTLKVDATGPSLSSANSNTTSVATSSYFCLNVTASDSLSTINQVFAQITNTTATANYTMSEDGTTCDGTASDGIYGVEITSTATGIVNYTKVFANDSLNNIGTLDFSDISITVTSSNTAPQVQIVGNDTMTNLASSGPNEGPTPTYVMINFTAYDAEGFTDLNMSSARINFTLSGESPRYNSCTSSSNYSTNYANFTCNVTVYWFDGAGTWSINATISDAGSTLGKNDTANFYIGALDAFAIAPTAMTWGSITAGLTDQNASNNPITLNNTGNVNKNISVNATNLRGQIDSAFALWAGNFSVSAESACRAQNMTDHSFVNITSATLPKGNFTINNGTTGQEKITICLNLAGSELIAQSHSTANEGAWTIKIVLAALSTRLTRRKKKKAKDSRLVDALGLIMDELKEEYLLDKKELTEIIVSKLKTRYKINKKEVIDMIKSAEEVAIPSAIFSKELGALESIVKYMKENLSMNYKEISERLERNERTIWTAYKKASEKTKSLFEIKEVEINIPIEVFKNSKLTVLESAIIYLKEKGFKYSEISRLLNRDQRNIRTACIRAINKKK
ncbi:hypothetical protein HYT23_05715 [Candidatus Pacearchaeota archaeon]|nr:hypothetical protein [Candidatus Pacearchaeota archaeon]